MHFSGLSYCAARLRTVDALAPNGLINLSLCPFLGRAVHERISYAPQAELNTPVEILSQIVLGGVKLTVLKLVTFM